MIAGHTTLPVIGIPVKSSFMDGLDSLLSTVQMPTGIPVATVAVGGGDNAAYLAAQMLSIKYPILAEKLLAHRERMAAAISSGLSGSTHTQQPKSFSSSLADGVSETMDGSPAPIYSKTLVGRLSVQTYWWIFKSVAQPTEK